MINVILNKDTMILTYKLEKCYLEVLNMDKISVNTGIVVIRFNGYIENIGKISTNILTKISIRKNLF